MLLRYLCFNGKKHKIRGKKARAQSDVASGLLAIPCDHNRTPESVCSGLCKVDLLPSLTNTNIKLGLGVKVGVTRACKPTNTHSF